MHVDTSAERLTITIKEREDILQATREELDDTLYKGKLSCLCECGPYRGGHLSVSHRKGSVSCRQTHA